MICYSTPTTADVEMAIRKPKQSNVAGNGMQTYYDRNHEEDWCKVVTTQPDGTNTTQHLPEEPRNYIGLAMVVLLCFNIPFGIAAVILSVKANQDFQKGNSTQARVKGKLSMALSVFGIVSTMTTVLLVIFWPAIAPDNG